MANEADKYLKTGRQVGASDVHLAAGAVPTYRVNGALRKIKAPPLTPEDTEGMIRGILSESQLRELIETQELDFSYVAEDVGRCRANACIQQRGWDMTFRLVTPKVPTLEELNAPKIIKKFLDYRQGLILITGSAGCGKTTTLASMVDYLNNTRPEHIISLEDPIEIVQPCQKCHIIQREVGRDTESFARALRAALREDPDIIVVGEMRDLETISNAITAAETGHLVLGTLHTTSAARTVSRLMDVFPPSQQEQIRAMVASSLRGVVTQQLVPRADGKGRISCFEILVVNLAVSNLISKDQMHQIESQMQTGLRAGMCLMDDALYALLNQGLIAPDVARHYARNRARFDNLEEMRKNQVNWTTFQVLDDKLKRRELENKKAAVRDRKTKQWRIPTPDRVAFLFYQEERGRLPEEAIYPEILRLYPEHIVEGEEG